MSSVYHQRGRNDAALVPGDDVEQGRSSEHGRGGGSGDADAASEVD
jgi:hypothetical protein